MTAGSLVQNRAMTWSSPFGALTLGTGWAAATDLGAAPPGDELA
jgi:hypothetical protein